MDLRLTHHNCLCLYESCKKIKIQQMCISRTNTVLHVITKDTNGFVFIYSSFFAGNLIHCLIGYDTVK